MASPSQYLSSPSNSFIPLLLFLFSSISLSSQTVLPPLSISKPGLGVGGGYGVDVDVDVDVEIGPGGLPPKARPTRYNHVRREFLRSHNQVRATYGQPPYRWDSRLARYSRRWASHLRDSGCTIFHSNGPYGENLFWGSGSSWRPAEAVQNWASEKEFYNLDANSCAAGKQCGHFTQLVWNETTHVGCARVFCSSDGVIIACSYNPPGNWLGQKPYNVAN